MKTFKKILVLLCLPIIFWGMLVQQGCSDDGGADDLDNIYYALNGTWKLQSASRDGVDVTAEFKDLKLDMGGRDQDTGSFNNTKNSPNSQMWPSNVKYEVEDDTPDDFFDNEFILSTPDLDRRTMLTKNPLTLTFKFTWAGSIEVEPGRTTTIGGEYEFIFIR